MKSAPLLLLALTAIGCRPDAPAIKGTAAYAGGRPLPPDAVFEASLLDLPGGGAPGTVIGSILTGGPGASPIAFRLPYQSEVIDTTHRYFLRARLLVDGSVFYVTDQPWPVLTGGHGREAAITLVPVSLLRDLPASFIGTLPCDECAGIRYQLDLLPDSVFYRRTIHRGAADSLARDDIGRWTLEDGGARLSLRSGSEVESFAPFGASILRRLDRDGRPIAAGRADGLRRTGTAALLEPALLLRGRYSAAGDGARFADCRTGRSLPVVPGPAADALTAAYRRIRPAPGAEVEVWLEGRIRREGPQGASAVVVTRFLDATRSGGC